MPLPTLGARTPLAIPLHPLVVHAAVVSIPTAAVLSACFVLRPDWRWALRLPTALLDVVAVVVPFITRATGEQLAHATPDNRDLIERHDQMAGLLTASFLPLTAPSLFACWSFASRSSWSPDAAPATPPGSGWSRWGRGSSCCWPPPRWC